MTPPTAGWTSPADARRPFEAIPVRQAAPRGAAASPDLGFIELQEALAGRYSIERELGRGGMGIVYLAREVRLDRLVALKVLPPALAARPELRERFLREASTAAGLSHPNIVPIFAVDEVLAGHAERRHGRPAFVFFAMAYVDGETLGERVRARGPLAPHEAARVLRETAWALAYAHARGIVHRDVKPDNIMLERGGRVLVMDFGIAHVAAGTEITGEGLVMGTAQFMSPEQAAGEPLDGRSDLYSLGVVGHVAVSGRLPFEAADARALLAMHIATPAPAVASRAPGVPRAVAQAIDRCLAKDPAARFPSGEALAEALDQTAQRAPDIPAPLRVWLAHADKARGPLTIGVVYSLMGATVAVVRSGVPFLAPLPLLVVAAAYTATRLYETRRVLRAGYEIADLRAALDQHVQRRREELAFDFGTTGGPSRIAQALRIAGYAGFGVAGILALANGFGGLTTSALGISSGLLLGGVVAELIHRAKRRMREHYGDWMRKLWDSPRGERFARIAGWRLGQRAAPAQALPQATEVALGRATEHLFAALPKAQQKTLAALPETVRRLEADGRRLRLAMDELDAGRAAAESGAEHGADVERRRGLVVADLRDRRARLADQHAGLVATLEGIRLDLLRLHGGAVGVDSLTATLEAARRLGDEVSALADGRAEVERLLDGRR